MYPSRCSPAALVILPDAILDEARALSRARGVDMRTKPIRGTAHSEVEFSGANKHKVAVITAMFEAGRIHVLAGTKSLLGEGWDSPSINSLILASFVGSFVLTNQMRGARDPHGQKRPRKDREHLAPRYSGAALRHGGKSSAA